MKKIPLNNSKIHDTPNHIHGTFSHDISKTPFGHNPHVPGYVSNAISITENDKLPWPYPYEHTENQQKWRPIKPNIDVPQYEHFDSKLTVVPINEAPPSTTTNPLIFPADQNPIPTIINPTSPYHPYSYETVYITKNTNLSEDGGINAFDTPNDIRFDDNGNLHAKDGLVPAENIDNKLVAIVLLVLFFVGQFFSTIERERETEKVTSNETVRFIFPIY